MRSWTRPKVAAESLAMIASSGSASSAASTAASALSGPLALSARMSLRVASLTSRRRAPRASSRPHDLLLVDEFREAPGDRGERLADVAKERHVGGVFASERLRVVRDMQHGDAFGHRLGFAIGIGDEGASADQHDRLRRLQVSAHVGEVGLQHARPAGMVGRKRGARRELSAPDRKAAGLGEGDEASARGRRQVVAEQDDDLDRDRGSRASRPAAPRRAKARAAAARRPAASGDSRPDRECPSAATETPARTAACAQGRRRAGAPDRHRRRGAVPSPIWSPARRARRGRRRATARSSDAVCPAGRR